MSKFSAVRFFAVVFVIFSIGACVLADFQLKGPGTKKIVVDKESLDYKMNYVKTYAFYNTTDVYKQQIYTLDVGGCEIKFITQRCGYKQVNHRHHTVKNLNLSVYDLEWLFFHDDFPFGTVKSSSISFHGTDYLAQVKNNQEYTCNAQFDSISEPGKYVIDVSLAGDVAPDLVVNFIGAELFTTTTSSTTTTLPPTTTTLAPTTTTQEPTTVSTTQASSSILSTSTSAIISATVKPPCPQCEERGLEGWLIGLIVAVIILALLAIVLCAILFCCYRRMQQAKAQKVVQSEHKTVGSTMSTVSTAPGPLVKETNLYGPDMMYFGRDATPVDPNAKSQAVSPGPQATSPAPQAVSPAPATSPIQPAK